jgi:hypothetical protein
MVFRERSRHHQTKALRLNHDSFPAVRYGAWFQISTKGEFWKDSSPRRQALTGAIREASEIQGFAKMLAVSQRRHTRVM